MNNSRGLLYPALHKFYSALNSLEKFEKGTNFFDNISYLDNFFSEYRNITFVLQKSLANTLFMSSYKKLRDQYLVNDVGKWFIEKRNEVLKQQPFNLEKRIVISIYSSQNSLSLPELIFTICIVLKKFYTFWLIILLQVYTFFLILNSLYIC